MAILKALEKFAGSALGGLTGGALSAGLDYASAKSLQNDSQAFTKEQWLNKHQWEVEDLRAAGLNPILSAHGAGSPGGSGTSSASPGQTLNQARMIAAQIALAVATARKVGFEADAAEPAGKAGGWISNTMDAMSSSAKTVWEDTKAGATSYGTKTNQYRGINRGGLVWKKARKGLRNKSSKYRDSKPHPWGTWTKATN